MIDTYQAKHRYADVTPRKMRPIATMVRGMQVDAAMEALRFMPNRGARLIEAVVKSAMGNAEDQGCRSMGDLVLSECRIDGAPMFKRIRPRARGTAFGIKRRMAHIIVALKVDASAADDVKGTEDMVISVPTNTTAVAPAPELIEAKSDDVKPEAIAAAETQPTEAKTEEKN